MTGEDEIRPGPGGRSRRRREPSTLDLTAEPVRGPETREGETGLREEGAAAPAQAEPESLVPGEVAAPAPLGPDAQEQPASRDTPEVAPGVDAPLSAGTADGIGEAAASAEAPAGAALPPAGEPRATSVPPAGRSSGRGPSGLTLALAALAGGIVGAILVLLGLWQFGPDVTGRFAALDAELGRRASSETVQGLDQRVGTVESRLKTLGTDVGSLAQRPQVSPKDVASLADRVGGLDSRVGALESRPAPGSDAAASAPPTPPPPPPAPVPALGSRESAVLSVAMLVRDDLQAGQPYGRELDALKQAGVDQTVLSALEPFARTGAPSQADLVRRFDPLHARLSEAQPQSGATGFAERVRNGLARIFRVRRTGDVAGDDPASVAARVRYQLEHGQLGQAASSLDSLPEPQRGEAKGFADLLRQRQAAAQAVDVLLSQAVDRLLAATAAPGGAAP